MRFLAALVAGAFAVSCASLDAPGTAEQGPLMVVSTTILGNVVGQLVGDRADVEVLMPVGADAHSFIPSAAQAATVRQADLVVVNGLGLEEGLSDLLAAAAEDGVEVFEASAAVEVREFEGGGVDPHFWLDPTQMVAVVRALAAQLAEVGAQDDWPASGDRLAGELEALDAEVADILAAVPHERRELVTNHEALGYFAERYDFEVVAAVIPGGTTLVEPSAASLEDVVHVVRERGVPAIFAETSQPARLAEAVAAEVGREVEVVELFTESLSEPDGPAATYPALMRTNATRIAEALTR